VTPPPRRRSLSVWIEALFAAGVLACLAWVAWHLSVAGYLPQPYFYESFDTWMDWFNTAYYAHNGGIYDDWRSVYLPLSFVILKLFSNSACYGWADTMQARNCDWISIASIHLIFLVNIPLVYWSFRKVDKSTALPRTIATCLGLPMTFTLERGNLLLLTFTFLLLAYGPLLKSARLRWLAAGLAVNMKIYLIGTIFAQLLRHRWRWFEGALAASVVIYLLTFAIVGEGSPGQIIRNLTMFSESLQAGSPLDVWYSSTYQPMIVLLEHSSFPAVSTLGSNTVEALTLGLPLAIHFVQVSIVIAAVASWARPEVVPLHRLVLLSIAMAIITTEAGGYAQVLLLPFVFMERWHGPGRIWALIATYLLCLPIDIPIGSAVTLVRESYLGGREVFADYFASVGQLIRPGLILSIALALSMVTMRDVWTDIRRNGWRWPIGRPASTPLPAS